MSFHLRLKAAVSGAVLAAVCLTAAPSLAQNRAADLREQVGAYAQPSNAERLQVLLRQLRAEGFAPTVETFDGGGRGEPMQGSNVVVTLGEGAKEILLTAHYDAVKLRDGTMADGLVDNAGSVVAVIEAAKILREAPLSHRIRIIFFDQEELGLIGARKWIEAHGLANGPQSAFVTRAVQELCAEQALQCVGLPIYPPSDDRAFSAAGAPVVSLGFQDEIGAHQMWLAFNGGKTNGLAEGFVPQVFRLIHSKDDAIEAVEGEAIDLAGRTYAALIRKLDAQLR